MDTPPIQFDDVSPAEMANHIHADTSFADKSMADVLAEAQQDPGDNDGDDGADVSMQDANDSFGDIVKQVRDTPQLTDMVEHVPRSPSSMANGHSPRLKADFGIIKAES